MKRRKQRDSFDGVPSSLIAQGPVRIVSYDPGTAWQLGHGRVTVVTQMSAVAVLVRRSADDVCETVDVASLTPWVSPSNTGGGGQVSLNSYPDEVWNKALEEHRLISALFDRADFSLAARQRVASNTGSLNPSSGPVAALPALAGLAAIRDSFVIIVLYP
jgi:hypothetical protein